MNMNPFELVANSVKSTVRTPVWVYAHPSMEHLAQSIVDTCLAGVPDTPSSSQVDESSQVYELHLYLHALVIKCHFLLKYTLS